MNERIKEIMIQADIPFEMEQTTELDKAINERKQPKREWVGLTDEEFDELDKEDLSLREFVQAIDDRLKEKNR